MTLNLNIPTTSTELKPKITVIGVGGAGGNAVNNMIQSNLGGVDFLACNTDSQALQQSLCERRVQLGRNMTQALGAGSRPDIGRAAAEEAMDEILIDLEGAHMVFVTAGMGGGTGTGAAPVIARAARETGILTVGVITKPFHFEGVHRMRLAEAGINELTQYVDTLIIIPNQNLFRVANEKTTFADAFKMADDVLESGVRGVTDLMVNPGLINLDFADIRSVMSEMGKAMMGTGEADGDNRAVAAAEAAISNPLLDDVSMKGARGVLINITGGHDLTLFEVDEAANRIRDEVDPEANIIFGSTFDERMEGDMRVSVVATGIDAEEMCSPKPVSLSVVSGGAVPQPRVAAPAEDVAGMASIPSLGVTVGLGGGVTAHALAIESVEASIQPAPEPAIVPEPQLAEILPEPQPAEALAEPQVAAVAPEPPRAETVPEPAPIEAEPMVRETAMAVEAEPAAGSRSELPQEPSRGDFFAPPPPARAEDQGLNFDRAQARPEPFAEAELANASSRQPGEGSESAGAPRRRGNQSLFARVTSGAARALQAATNGIEPTPQKERPTSAAAPQAEPSLSRPNLSGQGEPKAPAQTSTSGNEAEQPTVRESQPRLSGLDTAERIRTTEVEEDLLDIPAFLRRQAN